MTATQHGGPGDGYGSQVGGVPSGYPGPTVGPPAYGYPPMAPAPRRGGKLLGAGVIVAILLAAAALVVGIVDLAKPTPPAAAAATTATPTAPQTGDTSAADRALCTAIAPLMGENDKFSNAYIGLGEAGSPARDQALPKFISDTQNWVSRAQPILDENPDASGYLRRTLQRFLDDRALQVSDMGPGPLTSYAQALWTDSLGAYAGPLHVCDKVGVRW